MDRLIIHKKIYFIVFIILFTGCNKVEKFYYPTGELFSIVNEDNNGKNHGALKIFYKTGELEGIGYYNHGEKVGPFKEYYKTGELKSIENYRNNIWIDTTKFFYKTGKVSVLKYRNGQNIIQRQLNTEGNVISEGKIKDTLLTGWWNYYNSNGILNQRREYNIIDKQSHLNQIYYYDEKGNILKDSSNFFILNFQDTIPIKKLVTGKLILTPQLSKKDNFHKVYFKYFDTSRNDNIPLDSTYGQNNKPALLWVKFNSPGKKKIKGYILESKQILETNKKDSSMVDIISVKHKMYFEKEIYVK